jgi:O-methyltransferase
MATDHFSPFLNDASFQSRYATVANTWHGQDIRWRLWILTRCARQCESLEGSFAEFGTYRGGCAFMVLSECHPHSARSFFLFDTFKGIPDSNLTVHESGASFKGRLADVSVDEVRQRLAPWREHVRFVVGDVFETLRSTETGPLAFAHMDLNAAAPTELALGYTWSRLVRGGMVIFDDYGWDDYADQRKAIDRFFEDKHEGPIALPTGQALIIKR